MSLALVENVMRACCNVVIELHRDADTVEGASRFFDCLE